MWNHDIIESSRGERIKKKVCSQGDIQEANGSVAEEHDGDKKKKNGRE